MHVYIFINTQVFENTNAPSFFTDKSALAFYSCETFKCSVAT